MAFTNKDVLQRSRNNLNLLYLNMPDVLVTGANGFIGTALCNRLLGENFRVHGAVRPGKVSLLPEGVEAAHIESIDGDTDWINALKGIDFSVH